MNGEELRGCKPHRTRIRTRWTSNRGMVADKKEECGAMQMKVLSYSCGVGSIGTRNDEREGKAVRLQKQGRRRSGAVLHARLILLTAHRESGMNEHHTPKSSEFYSLLMLPR